LIRLPHSFGYIGISALQEIPPPNKLYYNPSNNINTYSLLRQFMPIGSEEISNPKGNNELSISQDNLRSVLDDDKVVFNKTAPFFTAIMN